MTVQHLVAFGWPPNHVPAAAARIDMPMQFSGTAFHIAVRSEQQMKSTGARAVCARRRKALPIIREPLPRLFVLEIKIDDGELDAGGHADERIRPKLPPRVDLIGIAARVVESVRRKRLLVRAAW